MSETTKQQIEDLDIAIETATTNIAKATKLGLKRMAQDVRRERRAIIEKRAALSA